MAKRLYALNRLTQSTPRSFSDCVDLDCTPSIQITVCPKHLVALTSKATVAAEKFRVLAVRLQAFQKRQLLKTLLITSSVKGEGKSVVSANLAVTLAQQGQRVLLIDGDLRQSGLGDVLGSHGQPGLSDWWGQPGPIADSLRRIDGLLLWYLSAGNLAAPPVEIFPSQRFTEMLFEIAKPFDWIIIDSPPLVPVADSSLLVCQADGCLMVVRQRKTPKSLLRQALQTDNLKLLGIVANDWEDSDHRYYGRYYGQYPASPHQQFATDALNRPNGHSLPLGPAEQIQSKSKGNTVISVD